MTMAATLQGIRGAFFALEIHGVEAELVDAATGHGGGGGRGATRSRDGGRQLRSDASEERAGGEPESEGEVRGGVRRLRARIRSREASSRWPGTHACAPCFPSAYWQEEEDGSALGGLGRYSARTGRPAQVTLSLCFLV